jgi:hypothetical protein
VQETEGLVARHLTVVVLSRVDVQTNSFVPDVKSAAENELFDAGYTVNHKIWLPDDT